MLISGRKEHYGHVEAHAEAEGKRHLQDGLLGHLGIFGQENLRNLRCRQLLLPPVQ